MADCLSGDLLKARLQSGAKANILFVGDSLHNPANYYPQSGWIKDSRLANKWRAFWAMTQTGTSQADHGYSLIEVGASTTGQGCGPGQAHPTETTTCQGWHLRSLRAQRFTTNPADSAFLPYTDFLPTAWHTDWMTSNANLRFMELGVKHTNAPSSLLFRYTNKSNTSANTTAIAANGANALYLHETPTFNGGSVSRTTITGYPITSAGENETGKGHCAVLRGIRDTNKTTGIQIAYAGEGGWNVKSHMDEAGYTYSSPVYTGYYKDAAIQQEIQLLKHDTYLFAVHTNQAPDGWNGTTLGNFKANYRTMLNRYRTLHNAARVVDPTIQPFVGVMIRCWPCKATADGAWGAGDEPLYAALDTCFRELWAESPTDLVYMDLHAKVRELQPNVDTMRTTYTADGIHPNPAGGVWFGAAQIDLSLQGGAVPSSGGYRGRVAVTAGVGVGL